MVSASSVSIPVWFDWEDTGTRKVADDSQFQFQYGSIGSVESCYFGIGYLFVSIPVWFDWECIAQFCCCLRSFVSIPVWFDWESLRTTPSLLFLKVSIPVWFDWESSGSLDILRMLPCFNSSMVRLGVT